MKGRMDGWMWRDEIGPDERIDVLLDHEEANRRKAKEHFTDEGNILRGDED